MDKDTANTSAAQRTTVSNSRPVKTGFGEILGETWNMYKKHFKLFSAIFIIPTLIVTAVNGFMMPTFTQSLMGSINEKTGEQFLKFQGPLATGMLVVILSGVVIAVINFITYGAMLRACGESESGNATVGKSFSFSWGRFWQGIVLSLRIFYYTMAWIGLLLCVLFLVAIAIAGAMRGASTGMGEQFINQTQVSTGLGLIGLVAICVLIVVAIVAIIRNLKAVFAFPLFFNDEKITPKEALDKSIKLSEGITGTIFVNYLLMGLLFAVIGGIYGGVVAQGAIAFLPMQSGFSGTFSSVQQMQIQLDQVLSVLTLPLMVVAGTMGIIFQFVFMKKAAEEKSLQ